MSGSQVVLRVAYRRYGELRDDVAQQMLRGGLLIKVHDVADLTLDTPVRLELVLPDGHALRGDTHVLQVLAGFGVAVHIDRALAEQAQRAGELAIDDETGGPALHQRLDPPELIRRGDGTPPTGVRRMRSPSQGIVAMAAPPAGRKKPPG